jgi:hypothetical protein
VESSALATHPTSTPSTGSPPAVSTASSPLVDNSSSSEGDVLPAIAATLPGAPNTRVKSEATSVTLRAEAPEFVPSGLA